jgi:HEAT repeat protein
LFLLFADLELFAESGNPSQEITEQNVKILQDIFKTPEPKTENQLHSATTAILQLTQLGNQSATPELKKLLATEELNTVVRTALLNLGEAGVVVLRESLDELTGKNLAGVIDSLAAANDKKSIDKIINLTKHENKLVAKSAILALGKFAAPEAVKRLTEILSNHKNNFQEDAAIAALQAAETLAAENKIKNALHILNSLRKRDDLPEIQAAATQSYVLLNENDGLELFAELLLAEDKTKFKTALNIAVKIKSPEAVIMILFALHRVDTERKVALIGVLGVRKEKLTVPLLIDFADSEELQEKVAAVKALGKIGDMKAFNTIFNAAADNAPKNIALTIAGKESLMLLEGKEFNTTIIQKLDSESKDFRLTALKIVEQRRIRDAANEVKLLFKDKDEEVRTAAYHAFAQIIIATTPDLEFLLNLLHNNSNQKSEFEQTGIREALKTVCRKIPARDQSVTIIEKFNHGNNTENRRFLMDLLFFLGGEKAGKAIANAAQNDKTEIADHATMLLGKWSTPDVAPLLLELAKTHPVEKFRVRTLSGYIRIIRQMVSSPEEKLEMLQKAEQAAQRDTDKKRIAEIKERVAGFLRGKPIFDGKTLEGWEGNPEWFKVKDGAIIAGNLNKRIPQNEFICTIAEYSDFTLYVEVKVIGKNANAGVQFRSKRKPKDSKQPNEVEGYQADMTETEKYWGCLYDESRRNKFLAEANINEIKTAFNPNSWNELKVTCKDNNIKLYVNGKLTVDYTETDGSIPKKGIIGLQIHAGNPSEAHYRNIRIEE